MGIRLSLQILLFSLLSQIALTIAYPSFCARLACLDRIQRSAARLIGQIPSSVMEQVTCRRFCAGSLSDSAESTGLPSWCGGANWALLQFTYLIFVDMCRVLRSEEGGPFGAVCSYRSHVSPRFLC